MQQHNSNYGFLPGGAPTSAEETACCSACARACCRGWVAFFFCICLCSLSNSLRAQQIKVTTAGNGGPAQPLTGAAVYLRPLNQPREQNLPPSVTLLTDETGSVNGPYKNVPALVRVQLMGYDAYQDTLAPGQQPYTLALQGEGVVTDEVVVTGQMDNRSAQEAVHQVRVIDRQRIENQVAVNLQDVLRQQLNFRVSQDLVLGSVLSMQGLGGQNVKIMIDGVPVIGRQDGNIDLSQLNLQDVERIEIVEGPMAVNYGSDALGGVINIITRQNNTERWSAGASAFTETVGNYNFDANLGLTTGRHSFRASGGRNFFDGWSPEPRERGHQWNPREQYFGAFRYGWQGEHVNAFYRGAVLQELILNQGLPRTTPFEVFALDDRFRTHRNDHQLQLRGGKGPWNFQAVAGYNYFHRTKHTYRKDLVTLEERLTENPQDQDTTSFDLLMSRGSVVRSLQDETWQIQLGYEANRETGSGDRMEEGDKMMWDVAGFTNIEYRPVQRLTLRAGVRGGYHSAYTMPFTPALHARWQVSPEWLLRASYGRGFRAPSLKERHLFFVDINHNIRGNEELSAEFSDSWNAALQYRKLRPNAVWELELSGFYNDVRNQIQLALVDPAELLYSYTNIGRTRTVGSRVDLNYLHKRFEVRAGGTFNGISNSLAEEVAEVPTFSFSPEARVQLTWRTPLQGLQLNGFYKYNGRVPQFFEDAEGEVIEGYLEDFHTVDATVTKFFWGRRVRLDAGGRNLLDVRSINALRSTGAHGGGGSLAVGTGRTAFAKLTLQFD